MPGTYGGYLTSIGRPPTQEVERLNRGAPVVCEGLQIFVGMCNGAIEWIMNAIPRELHRR